LQRDQAVGIERESRKPFDLTFSGSLLERSAFLNRTQESPAIETMFYSTLVDYDLRVLVLADWSQRFAPVRLIGSLLANVGKNPDAPKPPKTVRRISLPVSKAVSAELNVWLLNEVLERRTITHAENEWQYF
jgi:hypothetical protein